MEAMRQAFPLLTGLAYSYLILGHENASVERTSRHFDAFGMLAHQFLTASKLDRTGDTRQVWHYGGR